MIHESSAASQLKGASMNHEISRLSQKLTNLRCVHELISVKAHHKACFRIPARGNSVRTRASSGMISSGRILGMGSCCVDYLAAVKTFPCPDEKLRTDALEVQGGGNCANALTAAARLGLSTTLVSKIGGDSLGDGIIRELAEDGVDTAYTIRAPGYPSPFTYIIVDKSGGTRTCIHTPGAVYQPEEIPAELLDPAFLKSHFSLVYFDGRLTEAAVLLASAARSAGVPILVEAERLRPGLEQLLSMADYVVTSTQFPTDWTGQAALGDALAQLWSRLPKARFIVTTLGSRGSVMLCKEEHLTGEGIVTCRLQQQQTQLYNEDKDVRGESDHDRSSADREHYEGRDSHEDKDVRGESDHDLRSTDREHYEGRDSHDTSAGVLWTSSVESATASNGEPGSSLNDVLSLLESELSVLQDRTFRTLQSKDNELCDNLPHCVSGKGVNIRAGLAVMAGGIPFGVLEQVRIMVGEEMESKAQVQKSIQASADRAAALNGDDGSSTDRYKMMMSSGLVAEGPTQVAGSTTTTGSAALVSSFPLLSTGSATAGITVTAGVRVVRASAAALLPEDVLDTTGAGDAFIGSLLYGLVKGLSAPKMLQLAGLVAACKCTDVGARSGLPQKKNIHESLLS
ncbi:hypothetical protein CEUSTIGMA_g6096.t1 [Chlamydomonas eustigma]|uniref:Carbohydrate kinase PfkB domain-containing protein n=1 Tax=Chlamydomonas eustigma TaxID=1157962 RepID=A0A250X6F7_9CHLO|nr:hypothetical protein CEUSTIGMA_g6096.t1 [Chlamydomonas eustigma]|eukprot:GAX78658.1 hypothetical protein CEUSTIGMA_g6096.t1 [Chlamydomonas eustigma]